MNKFWLFIFAIYHIVITFSWAFSFFHFCSIAVPWSVDWGWTQSSLAVGPWWDKAGFLDFLHICDPCRQWGLYLCSLHLWAGVAGMRDEVRESCDWHWVLVGVCALPTSWPCMYVRQRGVKWLLLALHHQSTNQSLPIWSLLRGSYHVPYGVTH